MKKKSFKPFNRRLRKFWHGPAGRFLYDLFINIMANLIAGAILSWLLLQ